MAVEHRVFGNEPIIFSIFEGMVSYNEALSCFHFVANFIEKHNFPMIFWISDTTKAQIGRSTLLKVVEATMQGVKGTGGDPSVTPVVIMNSDLYTFFMSEFQNRYHWAQFPAFTTPFEAFSFVEYLMAIGV